MATASTTAAKKAAAAAAPATAQVVDATALVKSQVEAATRAQNAAARSYEDALTLGRENFDAFVRAGTILTRGLQDIGKAVIGIAQEAVEESVAASRQLAGAKTLKEIIDLQAGLARNGLDKVLQDGSRLSDLSVKVAEEALAPINERVNATVDRLLASA